MTGNLLIADSGNERIRKVDTTGIITTVAEEVPVASAFWPPMSTCKTAVPA